MFIDLFNIILVANTITIFTVKLLIIIIIYLKIIKLDKIFCGGSNNIKQDWKVLYIYEWRFTNDDLRMTILFTFY